MALTVNGEKCAQKTPVKIAELLAQLKINPRKAAIVVNDEIVARERQKSFVLKDGDRIEILTLAVGG